MHSRRAGRLLASNESRSESRCHVARVVEATPPQGKTAATDAPIEFIAEPLECLQSLIELPSP
jgi:hypothetical protein